jgi:hypothetical protein
MTGHRLSLASMAMSARRKWDDISTPLSKLLYATLPTNGGELQAPPAREDDALLAIHAVRSYVETCSNYVAAYAQAAGQMGTNSPIRPAIVVAPACRAQASPTDKAGS